MSVLPAGGHAAAPRGLDAPLGEDEAALFAAAARALRAPELDPRLRSPVLPGSEPALRALWLRTGAAPPAPTVMPEQPLAPSVLGVLWRRLRAARALAAHE